MLLYVVGIVRQLVQLSYLAAGTAPHAVVALAGMVSTAGKALLQTQQVAFRVLVEDNYTLLAFLALARFSYRRMEVRHIAHLGGPHLSVFLAKFSLSLIRQLLFLRHLVSISIL